MKRDDGLCVFCGKRPAIKGRYDDDLCDECCLKIADRMAERQTDPPPAGGGEAEGARG